MALTKVLRGGLSTGVSDSSDATAITITSAENIGIGTSSPDEKLDVRGSLQVGVDGTTAGLIRLMDSGSVTEEATISTDANGGLTFGGNSGAGELIFKTNSGTERMRITTTNVGINTSSPTSGYMLHVGGSSGVHTKVKIEATTATGQAELDLSADPAGVSYLNLGDEDSSNIGYIGYFHSDNSMRFQTNAAEQVRIHSNGVLSASDGIALGVGTANTSSNVLDDYEEGTFTPTVQNATGYSAQFGTYKKIGHLVFINANITVTSASGSTNVISSLPFTSANTGNSAGNLSIGYYSDVNTAMVWLSGYVLNASTNVYISGNSAGHTGATIQHNGASMFKTSGNSRVMFSVVYEAA